MAYIFIDESVEFEPKTQKNVNSTRKQPSIHAILTKTREWCILAT